MKSRSAVVFICFYIGWLLASCTGSKFLPEGKHYYSGAKFKFLKDTVEVKKKNIEIALEEILEPKANGQVFGSRPAVWFYHVTGEPNKNKGFRYWVKYKLGKKPIYLSDVDEKAMSNRLKNYLVNDGYFRSQVEYALKKRKKSGQIIYTIKTGPAYKIREVAYPKTDSLYKQVMDDIIAESTIKTGNRYKLRDLENEQKRIENYLENKGFYYFDDNYLLYKADSSAGDYEVDLTLTLSKDTPTKARQIFTLKDVEVNPDYSISNDTLSIKAERQYYENYLFINDNGYVKPEIITKSIVFAANETYSEIAMSRTRERLMALGIYKFVNLKYKLADSSRLTSQIFLTPLPKKSLRLDLQAISKSNNFVGPSFSASYQNRNAFRGAELFQLKLNTSYEIQISGQNDPPLTAYELNLEGSLTIPRLISPMNFNYSNVRFIPSTIMSLGIRLQRRINVFQINSFEAKYGYQWQESLTKKHRLFPINFSFVQLSQTSTEFEERLTTDPNLKNSLQDQFIAGLLYDYTLNTKNAEDANDKRDHFYFSGSLDTSGNLINLTENALGDNEALDNTGITYSQFTKVQLDFRYYRKLSSKEELATRLLFGGATAYGNATEVPFIKQFSAGGSNSVRAFRARSLGPGTYIDTVAGSFLVDNTGDIKIEGSVEYRYPIIGVLEGALFVDAGNIWLWDQQDSNEKPGGQFSSNFINEIAIGAGTGLRLNFSFFILRFDLALPLKKPQNSGVNWVLSDIDPTSSTWRKDNLLLNIAIGFPF